MADDLKNYTPYLELGEVFELFQKAKSVKEKKEILTKYNTLELRMFLWLAFDPMIEWEYPRLKREIPAANPPDDMPWGVNDLTLRVELPRIARVFTANRGISPEILDKNAFPLLNSLHKVESDMARALMNGQPPVKGLTEKMVREVFPDLLTEKKPKTENENKE